jgi:NADH:ubiquinone oxidoreductase subunit E
MSHACVCAETISEDERLARLDAIIAEWRDDPGALIPVLQAAQSLFGHLPDPVLKRVALGLDKPFSEVAGVVSFYSFFSTAGRGVHTVRVCLGTACYVRGAKQVLAAFKQSLGVDVGKTTPDRLFTLEEARCFGACGIAPAAMVDDDVHQKLTPAKVAAIVAQYS